MDTESSVWGEVRREMGALYIHAEKFSGSAPSPPSGAARNLDFFRKELGMFRDTLRRGINYDSAHRLFQDDWYYLGDLLERARSSGPLLSRSWSAPDADTFEILTGVFDDAFGNAGVGKSPIDPAKLKKLMECLKYLSDEAEEAAALCRLPQVPVIS